MGLVESSSSSSMNFSASFSRRDSGESTRRIPYTSSIGSESKDGSLMEFLALAISTEMVSCPRRASILAWVGASMSNAWSGDQSLGHKKREG